MINLKMNRTKQGTVYDLGQRVVTLGEAIDVIVTCELCWGAKVSVNESSIEFSTKVFGDIDYTEVSGSEVELDFLKEVVKAYSIGKRPEVIKLILSRLGVPYDPTMRYCTEELGITYDLHLEGCSDLTELIRPVPKSPTTLTVDKVTEVKDLIDKLDLPKDDGAFGVLMSSLV